MFVPRTAPGDLVEPGALRSHKRFARARPGRLIERSPDRVEPRCPHYVHDECGGCQLQHIEAGAQREARRGFVGDALRRLAKRDVPDPPLVPAESEFDYRTKITLAVSADGRRIGLHRYDRAEQVFDLHWCHITVPPLMEVWQALGRLRALLPPRLRTLVLRSDRTGRRHVLFHVAGAEAWDGARALAAELARAGQDATIWWQAEDGVPRAMAGAGEAYPATVFEQVHPAMGDRVRAHAIAALGSVAGRAVWDLYAGIGETTAALAAAGARVESVESDRRAVAEAEARGPGRPTPRRQGRAPGRHAEPRRPRRHESASHRDGCPGLRRARAAPAAAGRLHLVRSRDPRARSRPAAGLSARPMSPPSTSSPDRPRGDGGGAGADRMKYIVTLFDREVEVEVDGDRVTIGGRTMPASLGSVPGTPMRQLLLDGRSEAIALESGGPGRWAPDPRGRAGGARGPRRANAAHPQPHRRRRARPAPRLRSRRRCPGWWCGYRSRPDRPCAAGAGIVVLEAMKMENELRAPALVVIKSVQARPGEAVEKGQVLVEFE